MSNKRVLAQAVAVVGGLEASGDITTGGDLRTRAGFTGGGNVLTRSAYLGPAGFLYTTDISGNRVGFIGPDASPATAWIFGGGSGPGGGYDAIAIDLSSNEVTIPVLTTTTQAALDNSTKGATTAYVDAAVSAGGSASGEMWWQMNGGGLAIVPAVFHDGAFQAPYNGTITGYTVGNPSNDADVGTITIDVEHGAAGTSPTFSSMTASATPALTVSANKFKTSTTLTGWTTTIVKGDWYRPKVTVNSLCKFGYLSLAITKT